LTVTSPCSNVTAVKKGSTGVVAAALVVIGLVLFAEELSAALSTPRARGLRLAALVGGIAFTILWLAAMGLIRAARQPRDAHPAPVRSELGPEPPAVANLLTNDFDVEREAVPATLLDLAARRVVSIEEAGDSYVCRLGREPRDLMPYEERVLSLVSSRAVDGVVPAGALTTGPRDRAAAWWRAFRGEVIEDAQARDLCRDLWDRATIRWLAAAAIVPGPLFAVAAAHAGGAVAYGIAAAVILGRAAGGRRQRDTETGLVAASRWLGTRRHLREGAFADLPPTAVAIWERYLAYAAALGVAPAAVGAMPMGTDEDRRAWSAQGGTWRLVRIRYPWLWPPAWGWRPWAAAFVAAIGLVIAFGALRLAAGIGWASPGPSDPAALVAVVRGLFVFLLAVGTSVGLWSSFTAVRAVADLIAAPERRTGVVLRVRTFGRSSRSVGRHYVAVDDGRSPVIRALRIRTGPASADGVIEGEEATATVTPRLRFVRDLREA
jgi:Predicted membrane protein (DUF2207)